MLCQPLKHMPSRAAHLELGPIKRAKTNLEFSLHRAKKPNQLACQLGFSHSAEINLQAAQGCAKSPEAHHTIKKPAHAGFLLM